MLTYLCISSFDVNSLMAKHNKKLLKKEKKNLQEELYLLTLTSVFHRILDFKTGQDFYPSPFFI